MGVYVDLQPSPQFDRSLVTYCVVNFTRLSEAFRFVGKRIQFESWATQGPWPVPVGVNVPFDCTITIWSEITAYVVTPSQAAVLFTWDGVHTQNPAEMTFNEVYSHKAVSTTNTFALPYTSKGYHTYSQIFIGPLTSDANDRLRMHFTYYEL